MGTERDRKLVPGLQDHSGSPGGNYSSETFGEALFRSRTQRGWTKGGTAKFAGTTRNLYSNYESGVSEPHFGIFLVLCREFKLNPWDYFPGEKRKQHS